MEKIKEIQQQLDTASHGKESIELLKLGYEEADKIKNYDYQMTFRLEYIEESCFYSDCMLAMVVFPQVLKLHDDYEKEYGRDPFEDDVMWKYKWILENAKEFYQIDLPQFEALLEDYKQRCLKYGHSLRVYYQKKFEFYLHVDRTIAEEAFQKFREQPWDGFCDCKACERNEEIKYLLMSDRYEEAKEAAKPIFRRLLTCMEIPENTFARFLQYYNLKIAQGDESCLETAKDFCEKVRYSITTKQIGIEFVGDILLFYSMTNRSKALNWFKKYCNFFEENLNPVQKFYYALGMLRFLRNLEGKETYRMRLSPVFKFYQEDDTYSVLELKKYYDDYIKDFVKKIDRRNGNDYYQKIYEIYCS